MFGVSLVRDKKIEESEYITEEKYIEGETERNLEKLASITSLIEKLSLIENFIKNINYKIEKKVDDVSVKAEKKENIVKKLSEGILAVAAIILVTSSGGWVIPATILLATAGMIGITQIAPKVKTSTEIQLREEENFKIIEVLNDQKSTFLEIEYNLVNEDIVKVADSVVKEGDASHCFAIYQNLRNVFAVSAAEKIAGSDPKALEEVLSKPDNKSPKP